MVSGWLPFHLLFLTERKSDDVPIHGYTVMIRIKTIVNNTKVYTLQMENRWWTIPGTSQPTTSFMQAAINHMAVCLHLKKAKDVY